VATLRILLVEDSEDDAALILRELRRSGHEVVPERVETATDMEAALDRQSWDVIIADYALPQFSGLAALALVLGRGIDVPFLIVSGSIGEEIAVAAMKAGAHDYVMKGNLSRLVPAVDREIADAQVRRERRLMAERMQHDALHDSLTGLPNRVLFMDRLGLSLARAGQRPGAQFGVIALALDRFEIIIGSLGHVVADQLLVAVGALLQRHVGPADTVARLAGDEYAILLDDASTLRAPIHAAERIQARLQQPFNLGGQEVFVTASLGIVLGRTGSGKPEEILRDANTAMHRARSRGKGRHEVFDEGMHARAVDLLRLESDLRRALERRELVPYYQPIVNLETGTLSGFEALLRWKHPTRGLVLPDEFIPAAEENGLIVPIGAWVLREACAQAAAWQQISPEGAPLSMAVNVSGRQFAQPDLVGQVDDVLRETGIAPGLLHLEITESAIMERAASSTEMLVQLKALHAEIHVDDFGTGYSSLSYLHRFPIDALKVDRSFVSAMRDGGESVEIVRTIVALAQAMGLDVVAEGLETPEQKSRLRALGCHQAQGTLFGRPMDAEAATALISAGTRW